MRKIGKYISSIVFIFISGFLLAQKPDIQLSVNKKPVEVGQSVVFTLKSNIDGSVQFDFPTTFVQGGNSKSIQQSFINNSWSVVVEYAQEGIFKKEGKYTISATIKDKGKTYKSNPIIISVRPKADPSKARKYENNDGEITKHNMKEPVFGIIQKSSAKVYEGEPLILAAKVYSRVNLNMMQNYKSFSLKGAAETFELEKSDNFSLNRENYQGNTFLTFSCGKQLVFPATPGKFIVKPFEMILQYNNGGFFDSQLKLESNATFIEVLPLPKGAPRDFIGAVGKYSLETSVSNTKLKVGDVFTIVMKVKGTGNLHTISKPKLTLPDGLSFYGDPEIKEELDYTDDGVTGFKTFKFNVKVTNGGKIDLPDLSISYFDPSLKKYVTIKGKAETLEVEGVEKEVAKVQVGDSTIINGKEEVLVKSTNFSDEEQQSIPHANKWIIFLLVIIAVLAGLLFISSKKKAKKKLNIEEETKPIKSTVEPTHVEKTFVLPSDHFLEDAHVLVLRSDYVGAYNLILKNFPKYLTQFFQNHHNDVALDSLTDSVNGSNLPDFVIEDYQWIIKTSEEVVYGYLDKSSDWDMVYQKTKGIISYLNNR